MAMIFPSSSGWSGSLVSAFAFNSLLSVVAGVFSQVKEQDFYNNGQYRVDSAATETMLNSLMYTLCYYRFGDMYTRHGEE